MLHTHYTESSSNRLSINPDGIENNNLKEAKKRALRTKIAAGAIGISVLAGTFFAGNALGKGGKNPEPSQPIATESILPSESATPAPESHTPEVTVTPEPSESPATTPEASGTTPAQPTATPEATPPEATPETSEPASTQETSSPMSKFEMSADLLADPEKLAKVFFEEKLTEWVNAGATKENADAEWDFALETYGGKADLYLKDYAKETSEQFADMYANGLFKEGWENTKTLNDLKDFFTRMNAETLIAHLYTSDSEIDPRDKEPYKRGIKVTNTELIDEELPNTTIALIVSYKFYDNAHLNKVDESLTANQDYLDDKSVYIIRFYFSEVDGKLKLNGLVPVIQ